MKLESIVSGVSLTGLDPVGIGSVVAVVPIADGAVQVLYKTPDGALKERLLNRRDEASISIATYGSCPGYVVDHVVPLKRGGADSPSNMQWQRFARLRVHWSLRTNG